MRTIEKTAAILVYELGDGNFNGYLRECKKILILLLVCTQASEMLLYYKVNRHLPVVV